MKFDADSLPDDIETLKRLLLESQKALAKQDKTIAKQAELITSLIERYEVEKRRYYGAKSEQSPGAGETFNEAEESLDEADKALLNETSESAPETLKNKPKRKPLPKELPRDVVTIDLPDEDKQCDCCQGQLHRIGESRSEKLEFVPAHIKVIETVRPKYACRACERTGTQNNIKVAPMPATLIPKGIATASLLSQIISAKYQYGLPLYRQETMFNEFGIELSRKTMSDWIMRSSDLFAPLYDKLKDTLLKQPVLHADETPLKVINAEKATSYMWVYCSGSDSLSKQTIPNIVLFDYNNSRAATCVVDYLDGYSGYLQVDGYAAYGKTEATLAGCMTHARRKFIEAKAAQPKNKVGKADVILSLISKLYGIESGIKGKTPLEKFQRRQQQSKPIIDKIHAWAIEHKDNIPPKKPLGAAITYWLNQWPKLTTYLEDGRINIDNNRAERAIKPFVIGRKNWLFSNTPRGAKASAMLYSIIETAKANGLFIDDYLNFCLDELAKQPTCVEHLLPWNVNKG